LNQDLHAGGEFTTAGDKSSYYFAMWHPVAPAAIAGEENAPEPELRALGNPFGNGTRLSLAMPHDGEVRLVIYDALGRRVRTLLARRLAAGSHTVVWDGRDGSGRALSSGIYLAQFAVIGGGSRQVKLTVMR
jgi:hypothetical protein